MTTRMIRLWEREIPTYWLKSWLSKISKIRCGTRNSSSIWSRQKCVWESPTFGWRSSTCCGVKTRTCISRWRSSWLRRRLRAWVATSAKSATSPILTVNWKLFASNWRRTRTRLERRKFHRQRTTPQDPLRGLTKQLKSSKMLEEDDITSEI